MIQKLKKQFVFLMMTVLTIFLAASLGILYYTTGKSFREQSLTALRSALQTEVESPPPGRREETPTTVVAISQDGTVSIIHSHLLNLSEEDACDIAVYLAADHQISGTLNDKHIRYLSEFSDSSGTIRYAFADIFQEQTALRTLLFRWAIFGVIAFFVFLVVSVLLSIWLTRPVKTAWDKQQQFVADASHELKTPLTVILSNADMILKQPQLLDPKNLQRTHYIQDEARRMKDLVEDLLTLARNDSGHSRAVMETIDLSFLVQERVLAYEPVAFDMGKQIESQIADSLQILGDRKELEQLVTIFLDNACKYSRPGGLIQVTLNQPDTKHILLSVMDEGTPLTPEEQKHLFDRFYGLIRPGLTPPDTD